MKKMRVLMIGPGSPGPSNSGLGTVAKHIEEYLKTSVDLTLVEPRDANSSTNENELTESIFSEKAIIQDLVRIEVSGNIDPYHYFEGNLHTSSVTSIESSHIESELAVFKNAVIEAANEFDYDLIYAHDWSSLQAAINLKEQSGKPLVIHIHSLDIDRIASNHKSWVYDLEKEAIGAADAVITVSKYMADRVQKYYDGDPKKVHVIYPGISQITKVNKELEPTDPTVLFLGRLSNQKGPQNFIKIAEEILRLRQDIHFLMVGDGDQKEGIIEQVAQKGLSKNIHFNQFVDHSEIAQIFGRASVLCMPSFSEPFGMAAVEAASQGIPVVMSKQSGALEVLPGAIEVDNSNIAGFAEAIIKIIDDKNEYQKLVEANTLGLANLGWEKTVENILRVFNDVSK